jgi:putative transposase
MPPRTVPFYPQGHYHLYTRGAGRQTIFCEGENYLFFLRRLKEYGRDLPIAVLAYCLLPNHVHLLLRQDGDEPAGRLLHRVLSSYTKAFNKRYERTGTLFEGRYKALHVDSEGHLLHLCRYIHANPVRHGVVAELTGWPYSNYHEWLGLRPGSLIDRAFVREHFSQPDQYAQFVAEYAYGQAALPDEVGRFVIE